MTFLALLASPLVRKGLIVLAVLGVIWFAWVKAGQAINNYKADVREDVKAEIRVETLETELDMVKGNAAAVEARTDRLLEIAGRVRSSHTTIREQIASGEIPTGVIPPAKMATIDQIELMEAEAEQ